MVDMENLLREGFSVRNGRLCNRIGCVIGSVYVQQFGWGSPCTEYRFSDYDLRDYSIQKDAYGDWYLMRGYQKIRELRYSGGENWETKEF